MFTQKRKAKPISRIAPHDLANLVFRSNQKGETLLTEIAKKVLLQLKNAGKPGEAVGMLPAYLPGIDTQLLPKLLTSFFLKGWVTFKTSKYCDDSFQKTFQKVRLKIFQRNQDHQKILCDFFSSVMKKEEGIKINVVITQPGTVAYNAFTQKRWI